MAYKTISQFLAQWIDGFIPFAVNYQDVWDSHEKVSQVATLNASGETSMRIKYQGDVAPILTKLAAGSYQLDIGLKTGSATFVWRESGGTLSGGALQLTIVNADTDLLWPSLRIYSSTTGDEYTAGIGVTQNITEPSGTKTLTIITNVNNIPGDWIVTGAIL